MTSKQLREAIAARLAAVGPQIPIYYSRMPSTPDRCIVVTTYGLGDYLRNVQVRVRGSANSTVQAEDDADTIRGALHGYSLADLAILHCISVARMGADTSQRDEVAMNFQAVTSDPGTSLVDVG